MSSLSYHNPSSSCSLNHFSQPLRLHPKTESLNLSQILNSFSAAITEEHAFAIVHECMKTFFELVTNHNNNWKEFKLIESTHDILIHKEGQIHRSTFLEKKHEQGANKNKFVVEGATSINNDSRHLNEDKIIASLGLVIYDALDFGLKDKEERSLTPGLEDLLDLMTSRGDSSDDSADDDESDESYPVSTATSLRDTDDEGIEKDHDEEEHEQKEAKATCSSKKSQQQQQRQIGHSTKRVLSLCSNHLSVSSEAANHFKAVCRALVSESLELSTFLARARLKDDEHSEELHNLAIQDWAHLWIQTMHQLRQGVKLKKTSYTKTPIEYELTPYEILVDDIRSRRFKLNKVMVDGDIPPKIKKDAHDVILDFIRSRPPLRPASHRQLKPVEKYVTPHEKIMQSIRAIKPQETLRKTSGPPEPRNIVLESVRNTTCIVIVKPEQSPSSKAASSKPLKPKRLNLPSPSMLSASHSTTGNKLSAASHSEADIIERNNHNNSLSSNSSSSSLCGNKKIIKPDPSFINFDPDDNDEEENDDDVFNNSTKSLRRPQVTRVQITPDKKSEPEKEPQVILRRQIPGRRSVQFNSGRDLDEDEKENNKQLRRHSTLVIKQQQQQQKQHPHSSSSSSSSTSSSPESSPVLVRQQQNPSARTSRVLKSEQWASALKTLDLTLGEVVHIRSVLTKAELEGLTLDCNLREDLEKSKVCFLCMKVRFGIFTWSYNCQLCKHVVCSGCLTKMKIPSQQFQNIPVYELSPHQISNSNKSNFNNDQDHEEIFTKTRRNSSSNRHETSHPPHRMSIGSFATNQLERKMSFLDDNSKQRGRSKLQRSKTVSHKQKPDNKSYLRSSPSGGTQLNVCLDCKEMILQIIQSQRASRRVQFTKSLCLNK